MTPGDDDVYRKIEARLERAGTLYVPSGWGAAILKGSETVVVFTRFATPELQVSIDFRRRIFDKGSCTPTAAANPQGVYKGPSWIKRIVVDATEWASTGSVPPRVEKDKSAQTRRSNMDGHLQRSAAKKTSDSGGAMEGGQWLALKGSSRQAHDWGVDSYEVKRRDGERATRASWICLFLGCVGLASTRAFPALWAAHPISMSATIVALIALLSWIDGLRNKRRTGDRLGQK